MNTFFGYFFPFLVLIIFLFLLYVTGSMVAENLLTDFQWFRRWKGGKWKQSGGMWFRIHQDQVEDYTK